MIEQDYDTELYLVICDTKSCDHEEDYDTDGSWDELIRQMKLDGWQSRKDGKGDWKNYCPKCTAKIIQKELDDEQR